MKVRHLMTRQAVVISPATSLQDAAAQMREEDIGVLPVCELGHVVGIVTDRDLTVRAMAEGLDPTKAVVRQVMSTRLAVCFEEQDAGEAERMMQKHQIRRLPVLDRESRLVGMISLGDLATRSPERTGVARTLEMVSQETS